MSTVVKGTVVIKGSLRLEGPATYWVVGEASGTGDIAYAANIDRTSWTFYSRQPNNSSAIDAAYGKNASGNGIYVISNSSSTRELAVSSDDITDGSEWTQIDLPGGSQQFCDTVTWSNDSTGSTSGVWMAGRRNGHVYRSTNGAASFSEITLPNDSGDAILSIAGNGSGKFVTGQENRLLVSTDDGASFSSSTPFTAETINGVAYTNATWIVTYTKSGQANLFARTASDSDLTTWSSEVDLGIDKPGNAATVNDPQPRASIAASHGRVVIVSNRNTGIARLDISGTSTSNLANPAYSGSEHFDITTDGATWMIVTADGDIYESTDKGVNFSQTVDNIRGTGRDLQCVAASKHLPL